MQRQRGVIGQGRHDNMMEVTWSISGGNMSGGVRERCDSIKGTCAWVM
jgi:hypothetical protein